MSEPFIADYHETEEASPLVYDLGRVVLEWNMVEQFFTALIWEYLGDYGTGMAITGGLGNKSKADILRGLARQRSKNAELVDRVEFACAAFNILRENRNKLVHSHSIFQTNTKNGKPHWRRATGKGPEGHVGVLADLVDLEDLIASICKLGMFAVELVPHIRPRNEEKYSLPAKYPLPKKLADA